MIVLGLVNIVRQLLKKLRGNRNEGLSKFGTRNPFIRRLALRRSAFVNRTVRESAAISDGMRGRCFAQGFSEKGGSDTVSFSQDLRVAECSRAYRRSPSAIMCFTALICDSADVSAAEAVEFLPAIAR